MDHVIGHQAFQGASRVEVTKNLVREGSVSVRSARSIDGAGPGIGPGDSAFSGLGRIPGVVSSTRDRLMTALGVFHVRALQVAEQWLSKPAG